MVDGLLARLAFELRWARKFYLFLLVVIVVIAVILIFRLKGEDVKGRETTAAITSFSNTQDPYSSPSSMPGYVTARTTDGLVGRRRVTRSMVAGCEIGDEIPAVARGMNLELQPEPCSSEE